MLAEAVKGIEVQSRVIQAVILREMRTRFGAYSLGYLWAVFVPLLFVVTLTAIWSAVGRKAAFGAPIEVLLLSGMMAWLTFTDVQTHVSAAFRGNRPLLVYPMVTVFDVAIARTILELLTKLAAAGVLMLMYIAAGVPAAIDDYMGVITAFAILAYIGLMFGHAVSCIVVVAPSMQFIVNTTRRVLFFTSGALFLLSDIPAEWRQYLLYNPIAHAIDLSRGAWITGYDAPYFDAAYVFWWCAGLTTAAAIGEATTRKKRGGARR